MSLTNAVEPYLISIREELACHFDNSLDYALSTPLQELTLLAAPYALESYLSSPSSKKTKFYHHLLFTIRGNLKNNKSVKTDEPSGTAKAVYDGNGKLVMWKDSGVEGRITKKKFYGVKGEDLYFDSISAIPEFAKFSQEELRAQDYAQGRTGEGASTEKGKEKEALAVPGAPYVSVLLKDVLARLSGFFAHLLPGICTFQREVDTLSSFLSSYDEINQALERIHVRLVAGSLEAAPAASDKPPLPEFVDPAIPKEPAVDFKVKVKQGKQKKQQKQQPSKVLNAEEIVKVRDEELLKKAGIEIPSKESNIVKLKQDLIEKHAEALEAFVTALQEREVREMVLKAFCHQQGIEVESGLPTSSNSTTTSSALQPIQPQLRDGNSPAINGLTKVATKVLLHPSMRPLKAARLFECTASDLLGSWQVYFGSKANAQLRQLDKETDEVVAKKILQLSQGHFSADNMKKLGNTTSDIPIYEAKVTRDIRIVYQVDLYSNAETATQLQVLKIWGILTHAQIDNRLWSAISRELTGSRSTEYRKRVGERALPRKIAGEKIADVIEPLTFPRLQEAPMVVSAERMDLTEAMGIQLHEMLALSKWVPWSRSVLNAAIARIDDATHMFLLSEAEQAVVNYESSSFVIGRSGTGKTALFRLIGIEESLKDEPIRHKQLFVTKSAVLASKIRDYYFRLRETLDSANLTPEEMGNMARRQKEAAIDLADEEDLKKALPSKWSELTASHFPLFLSFDHLCSLIEADLGIDRMASGVVEAERRRAKKLMAKKAANGEVNQVTETFLLDSEEKELLPGAAVDRSAWLHFVDVESFCTFYWPHFSQDLTKGLDPLLCYSEFVGVIQGGIETLGTEKGYLSKKAYLALSARTKANFAHVRERIYTLFMRYRARKAERGDWDAADRTHAILRAMKASSPLKSIGCLFVDEAQDQLLIDTALLRSLVSNPMGHFWAGDTAQTISASSFRFEDLSAAFYDAEKADPLVTAGARPSIQPKMFNLLVNYRSHRGITNIAASLVDIVSHFFPNSIDSLGREVGIVDGTLPLIFDGFLDSKDLQVESFLFGSGDTTMEFGAEQCIIVRDEKARTELRAKLGEDFGLILTIYESKGLEFSDVLLYRFFSDSPASEAQWRIILALLGDSQLNVPAFDLTKHSVILNELRNLYVAVTRARNRLWIFDPSAKIEPTKLFLHKKGLVTLCRPGDPLPEMAVSSTPQQWQNTAKTLFDRRLYGQAANCYARAGKSHEAAIALAYQARENARDTLRASKSGRDIKTAFDKAAGLFAAVAGDATEDNRPKLYYQAALAYVQASDPFRAAQCYESARRWTEAARLYRKAQHFEDALRVLKSHAPPDFGWLAQAEAPHKDIIEQKEAELILQTSRLHYVRKSQLVAVRSLFESDEDELEWLDDYGFDTASLDVLESLGQYGQCAEIYLERGALPEAATFFDKAGKADAARDCLQRHLIQLVPLGTNISDLDKDRGTISKLRSALKKLDSLTSGAVMKEPSPIMTTYRGLVDDTIPLKGLIKEMAQVDASQELFALDFALQDPRELSELSIAELLAFGSMNSIYAQLLEPICMARRVTDDLLRLMAIEPITVEGQIDQSRYLVRLTSAIYAKLPSTAESGEGGAIAPASILPQLISSYFTERLFWQMKKYCDQAQRLSVLRPPCLSHAMLKSCNAMNCGKLHVSTGFATHFKNRLEVLSISLPLAGDLSWLAVRLSQRSFEYQECMRMRRGFLELWMQCLYPSHLPFGGYHTLQSDSEVSLSSGHQAMLARESLDCIYALSFQLHPAKFLGQLLNYSLLAATFNTERFRAEFGLTRAIRRRDAPVINIQSKRPLGEPLYYLLTQPKLERFVSVDVLTRSTTFIQSYLYHNVPFDLNAFCYIFETLTIMAIIGGRQLGGGGKTGFTYLTLPEALARQAVLLFAETRIQMYTLAIDGLATRLADVAALILEGDSRFLVDGTPLKGPVRPFVAARLLQLLALIGYNGNSMGSVNQAQAFVLRELRRILDSYNRNSTQGRRPPNLHTAIAKYLNARIWSDVQSALQDSSSSDNPAGQLVQLHLGSAKATNTVRGVRAVTASSLANLARRWRGEPEIEEAPLTFPSAWLNKNVKPSDAVLDKAFKGLVPSQIMTRSTATKSKAAETDVKSKESIEGVQTAEADSSIGRDLDEGFARSESVSSEDAAKQSGDAEAPQENGQEEETPIEFAPLKDMEAAPEITEEQTAAAKVIKVFWQRSRKRRSTKVVLNTPRAVHMQEMLAIAKRVPKSGSRMAYIEALLISYIHVKTVFDIALKEVDATKKKSSKRLQEDHIDLEDLHGKITAIINLRKRFMNVRKAVTETLPSGSFVTLRTKLEPLRGLIDELCNFPGTTVKLSVKEEMQKLCKAAINLFEDVPIPPTAKKEKRPALNMSDDLDDDLFGDDEYMEDPRHDYQGEDQEMQDYDEDEAEALSEKEEEEARQKAEAERLAKEKKEKEKQAAARKKAEAERLKKERIGRDRLENQRWQRAQAAAEAEKKEEERKAAEKKKLEEEKREAAEKLKKQEEEAARKAAEAARKKPKPKPAKAKPAKPKPAPADEDSDVPPLLAMSDSEDE